MQNEKKKYYWWSALEHVIPNIYVIFAFNFCYLSYYWIYSISESGSAYISPRNVAQMDWWTFCVSLNKVNVEVHGSGKVELFQGTYSESSCCITVCFDYNLPLLASFCNWNTRSMMTCSHSSNNIAWIICFISALPFVSQKDLWFNKISLKS